MSEFDLCALPSKASNSNDKRPHVVAVYYKDRRVICTSCEAAKHGKACWAQNEMMQRVNRRQARDLTLLLSAKERVYNTLMKHDDARNSDNLLVMHYFTDWHDVPKDLGWQEFMAWIIRVFGGDHLGTITRRRREWQEAGYFPACEEVEVERKARQEIFHAEFSFSEARVNNAFY